MKKYSISEVIKALTPLVLATIGAILGVFVLSGEFSKLQSQALLGLAGTFMSSAAGLAQSFKAENTEKKQLSKNRGRLKNPERYSNSEETRSIAISQSIKQAKKAIITLKLLNSEKNLAIFITSIAISFLLFCNFIIEIIFDFSPQISEPAIYFVLPLIILVWLRIYLLSYRIKKGYYGNNQHEARYAIGFINDELDKSPPSDSGGLGQVFPDPESEDYGWITDGTQAGEVA